MDLDEIAKNYIDQKNKTPLVEFDGFSPEEMYNIVYFPSLSKCPIKFNAGLSNHILNQAHIFKIVLDLLHVIENEEGIKLTPKGNIPPKIVKKIYNKKYIIDHMIENCITKLHREENWMVFHTIKLVLNMSGITRKYKGKLLLTKQTINYLEKDKIAEIFFKFLIGYSAKFNWAYNDGYGHEGVGQAGFLYLLHLLNKYGDINREVKFYAELYFRAFPTLKVNDERFISSDSDKDAQILELRFFERYANWFGFAEVQYQDNKNFFSGIAGVTRTEFLAELMKVQSVE